MDQSIPNLNKAVSLSFDESPEVRKQAAEMLGKLDDPAAVFALVELSYDKEPSVREVAHKQLEVRKKSEPELMSFAEIFSNGAAKQSDKKAAPQGPKEKVLLPITQIFEKRLGKEKAEIVKSKMMPSIEKIYQKAIIRKTSKKKDPEGGRKVMQEFLTSYLEVISDLDTVGGGGQQIEIPVQEAEAETELAEDIEEVGKPEELDNVSAEIATLEVQRMEEEKKHEEIEGLPDTFFKKAYETMMLSGGDEKLMKQEMKRMVKDAEKEITLAFKLAKKKFKETKVTNITKIKDAMRNINTEPLLVMSVENMEYQKTKKQKANLTRVLVNDDDSNEGVIYLFDDRGLLVKPGMKVKILKGSAKTFKFSGETALTLPKNGNIYIVL